MEADSRARRKRAGRVRRYLGLGAGFLEVRWRGLPNILADNQLRSPGTDVACYSLWKWPDIEGLDSFKGQKVHSADWDHSYDYSNKRIGLIGNGSSGIQILPQLAKLPGTDVTSFQRGPTWVVSRMTPGSLLGKDIKDYNPVYTEEDKKKFRDDPAFHNEYRKKLIHNINNVFKMVWLPCLFRPCASLARVLTQK